MNKTTEIKLIFSLAVSILITASGCAVHYFDPENNVEHIWGLGHMAMKVSAPDGGIKAVGKRTDIAGISISRTKEGVSLDVGWSTMQRIEVVDEDLPLCLSWPRGSSFYSARVGSGFPYTLNDCGVDKEKEIGE
ncbi:exported hypothetical protein [uncultured Desulfobacterium sp.]|uniref:Lipoprotein n=1 Tax=uncultured Desulfobacterium sp. TaxID=201089 RepID=A0A445MZK8_9BACT|nr:exported hypothetical protein [uncultured Desulfobacterium sp.]